jgi:hypothetical protein
MKIWQTIKAAFALGTAVPPDPRRLNAVDVFALSASVEALLIEERGWITLSEARAVFSPMDDQYAFGEMDEIGRANLAAFAAQSEHLCDFDLMPVEGRSTLPEKFDSHRASSWSLRCLTALRRTLGRTCRRSCSDGAALIALINS